MQRLEDWIYGALLVSLLVLFAVSMHRVETQAQTLQQSPLVSPGGRYIVTFDCWPEWAALFASQYAGGAALNPCYADDVTVKRLRSDGWVEVELQGSSWLLNLDRATGIAVKPQTQAAR